MRKDLTRFLPVLLAIVALAFLAGCQDNQASEKQMRLVAVENEQLKAQLSQCNSQLAGKDADALRFQDEIKELNEQLGSKLEETMSSFLVTLSEENERLQKENNELKAIIDQLPTN